MPAELRTQTRALADGRTEARFAGEVDVTNVAAFRQALVAAADGAGVVADVTDLSYLDSAGVEALFELARRTSVEVVAGPGCRIRRLLEVVAMDHVATVRDREPG